MLDIATTATSFGKIRNAADNGESLPEGLVMDHAGNPVTDPGKAGEGLLLPIGGYKGYGLSLMFSLLAGVLNGVATGRDTVSIDDASAAGNTGQAIMALNVANFGPVVDFKRRVDKVARDLRTSKPLPGGARGALSRPPRPPHRERARRATAFRSAPPLVASLDKLAAELAIAPLALQEPVTWRPIPAATSASSRARDQGGRPDGVQFMLHRSGYGLCRPDLSPKASASSICATPSTRRP